MTTTDLPQAVTEPSGAERSGAWSALTGCAATLAAVVAAEYLPRGESALIGAPGWLAPAGAGLGLLAVLLMVGHHQAHRVLRRGVLGTGWLASGLLLWAAGGVLFDLLQIGAWLGIRWIWSAPVDWPAFAVRSLALVSAVLLARLTLRYGRSSRDACLTCGRADQDGPAGTPIWLGYVGFLAGLPYPVIKTQWALGGSIGLDHAHPDRDGWTVGWLTTIPALIGLLLSLALVHRWGKIWPRWVPFLAGRRTPRWLLLLGGWTGTGVLLTMGIPAAVGIVEQALDEGLGFLGRMSGGMYGWVGPLFYCLWLVWGIALGVTTWVYQAHTRAACPLCGR